MILAAFSLLLLSAAPAMAQGGSDKAERKARQAAQDEAKRAETAALIDAQSYVFEADRMSPSLPGATSRDISGQNYFMQIDGQWLRTHLPYVGRAHTDNRFIDPNPAININETRFDYSVSEKKKNKGWDVSVKVYDPVSTDTYRFSLSVASDGTASLSVVSNYRSSISYSGRLIDRADILEVEEAATEDTE